MPSPEAEAIGQVPEAGSILDDVIVSRNADSIGRHAVEDALRTGQEVENAISEIDQLQRETEPIIDGYKDRMLETREGIPALGAVQAMMGRLSASLQEIAYSKEHPAFQDGKDYGPVDGVSISTINEPHEWEDFIGGIYKGTFYDLITTIKDEVTGISIVLIDKSYSAQKGGVRMFDSRHYGGGLSNIPKSIRIENENGKLLFILEANTAGEMRNMIIPKKIGNGIKTSNVDPTVAIEKTGIKDFLGLRYKIGRDSSRKIE